MRDYRIYQLDTAGHISGPSTILSVETDAEAIQHAKKMLNGDDLEVWHDDKRIIVLKSKDTVAF